MASFSLPHRSSVSKKFSGVSIDVLDLDIMLLIFKEIWFTHSRESRLSTAIVCRNWKTIAIPFQYKHMEIDQIHKAMTPGIFAGLKHFGEIVRENIRLYTRHITNDYSSANDFYPPTSDWKRIVDFLISCERLELLTFRYTRDQDLRDGNEESFPLELTHALSTLPHVNVAIEGFLFTDLHPDFIEDPSLRSKPTYILPASNIITFKAEIPDTSGTALAYYLMNPHIKSIFTSATNLEVLHLSGKDPWCFGTRGARLPPMKELELHNYLWGVLPACVSQIWDFSRLKTLILAHRTKDSFSCSNRLLEFFLRSVTPEDFPALRNFECTHDLQPTVDEHDISKSLLGSFIEELVTLKELRITGLCADILPHILAFAHNLKVLKIPIGRSPVRDRVISAEHIREYFSPSVKLEELHISCGEITELISHGVIDALCELKALHTITIEAVAATKEAALFIGEPECERILKYFWEHKKGVKLKFLEIRVGDYANNVRIQDDDFFWGAWMNVTWDGEWWTVMAMKVTPGSSSMTTKRHIRMAQE